MHDEDPEKLADELEGTADELEERSERLGQEAEATRSDWESKKADPQVPGAPQPESEDDPPREVGPPWQ